MEEVKVGDPAKDFTLKDQNGKGIMLSSFKGKKVLLSFHPLAWTAICAKQMQSLEANKETFDSLNTVALGMSVDTVPCKKAWAESLGIENISLLSDFWPHGEVAKLYGIFREEHGFSARTNIIVDEEQNIAFFKVYEPKTLPDINEIIDFIKNM
ncbi:MAG: peroxiredoxin [Methanomassiliicoccales archaeon]|nr:MAG: peroxiredoxin [Methanomassiliicoccales archaeon]